MSNPNPPASTIRDVAAAVGVSPMAVSKVLHGRGANVRVGAATAERIRQAARDLKYQPNHLARSLRMRRTHTIGLVFEHFERLGDDNGYFPQLLNGVMGATFPADYTLAICPKLLKLSETGAVADGRFDGVLWCKPDSSPEILEGLRNSALPIVMMHAPAESVPGIPTYCCDNEQALSLAVEHLHKLGHRSLGFVVDSANVSTIEGNARVRAFAQACQARGVHGDVLVWNEDLGALSAYADSNRPHTGLIAFSDFHAGRILKKCASLGIRVPAELSIVGFDSTPFCETTSPKMTSISQPVQQMAHDATVQLLRLIGEGGPKESPPPYACGLDVRESTGPAPR